MWNLTPHTRRSPGGNRMWRPSDTGVMSSWNISIVTPMGPRRRPIIRPVLTLLFLVVASSGSAHVALDAPVGGESLTPGSTFEIRWHDVISHGPADYDLWYSTTGPDGPWIDIAADLPQEPGPGAYTYDWIVPNVPSDHVRVRVQQDNAADDYLDVSSSDLAIVAPVASQTVVLEPAQDAAIYEESGQLANGAGSFVFAGKNASDSERRALLRFAVDQAIPAGATVTAVSLELTMSRTTSGPQDVELHRVLEPWSEGPSAASGGEGGGTSAQSGDVTWTHRVYPDVTWSSPGGTFASPATASVEIDQNATYMFAAFPGMVDDVQAWLDTPAENYGWMLVNTSATAGSAKRFNSRENSTASTRPHLTITFDPPTVPPIDHFVFLPAAANAAGANGSFFVTTADIHNAGDTMANFMLLWLPRNTENSQPSESSIEQLAPGESRRYQNLLAEVFGIDDAVGAIAVVSDSSQIRVMSRTFNQTADGTFGQGIPGIGENELVGNGRRARILFLAENAAYRSNLGVLNGTLAPMTVAWELFATDGSSLGTGSVDLPPWGTTQINRVLAGVSPIDAAFADVWTTTPDGAFTCYGSVLDELSSDPTTVLPQ